VLGGLGWLKDMNHICTNFKSSFKLRTAGHYATWKLLLVRFTIFFGQQKCVGNAQLRAIGYFVAQMHKLFGAGAQHTYQNLILYLSSLR